MEGTKPRWRAREERRVSARTSYSQPVEILILVSRGQRKEGATHTHTTQVGVESVIKL